MKKDKNSGGEHMMKIKKLSVAAALVMAASVLLMGCGQTKGSKGTLTVGVRNDLRNLD